jgi:hypothetical protein
VGEGQERVVEADVNAGWLDLQVEVLYRVDDEATVSKTVEDVGIG